jgi:hypothetical protein
VSEKSAAGTVVGAPLASSKTDPDAGQTFTYTVLSGNTLSGAITAASYFGVGASTGQLTALQTVPPILTYSSYTLTVRVTDSGGTGSYPSASALVATTTVTIQISELNAPPIMADQTRLIAENSAVGTLIGAEVVASDPDVGQTLMFSISSGNTGAAFAVSAAGQLSVSLAILDFEALPTYTLRVKVSDSGGVQLSAEATVVVSLTDVNEGPVLAAGQALSVPENSAVGTLIGAVLTATDVDATDSRVWAILSGNTGSAFGVNFATATSNTLLSGQARVATAVLDFEATPSYTLRVQVTDKGGLTSASAVVVTVTDVNEAPVLAGASRSVAENSVVGTLVGSSLTYSEPDAGQTEAVLCADGADHGQRDAGAELERDDHGGGDGRERAAGVRDVVDCGKAGA